MLDFSNQDPITLAAMLQRGQAYLPQSAYDLYNAQLISALAAHNTIASPDFGGASGGISSDFGLAPGVSGTSSSFGINPPPVSSPLVSTLAQPLGRISPIKQFGEAGLAAASPFIAKEVGSLLPNVAGSVLGKITPVAAGIQGIMSLAKGNILGGISGLASAGLAAAGQPYIAAGIMAANALFGGISGLFSGSLKARINRFNTVVDNVNNNLLTPANNAESGILAQLNAGDIQGAFHTTTGYTNLAQAYLRAGGTRPDINPLYEGIQAYRDIGPNFDNALSFLQSFEGNPKYGYALRFNTAPAIMNWASQQYERWWAIENATNQPPGTFTSIFDKFGAGIQRNKKGDFVPFVKTIEPSVVAAVNQTRVAQGYTPLSPDSVSLAVPAGQVQSPQYAQAVSQATQQIQSGDSTGALQTLTTAPPPTQAAPAPAPVQFAPAGVPTPSPALLAYQKRLGFSDDVLKALMVHNVQPNNEYAY